MKIVKKKISSRMTTISPLKVTYFYHMGVFSSKKKIAILYLSFFYLMLLGA